MTSLVTLLLDLYRGDGTPVTEGYAEITPVSQLTDPADGMLVTTAPVTADFTGTGLPVAELIPNDAPGPLPAGSAWQVTYKWVPGNPAPVTVQVPAGPCAVSVAAGTPGVVTWTPGAMFTSTGLVPLPAGTGVQVAGGAYPAGVTLWVVNPSGDTLELAASPGGPPLASAGGTGTLTVTQYRLSALSPVEPTEPMGAYAQLGGDLSGVPAQVEKIQGTPVTAPPDDASRYLDGTGNWTVPAGGAVDSVNGQTGTVDLTAADVGADAAGAAAGVLASSAQKSANLADLASPAAARGNLGLGSAATQPASAFDAAGAAAAALAASDPAGAAAAVQSASLQKTANLSDLANLATSRGNLGLGTAATQPSSAFDASGAAAAAQSAAQAYAAAQASAAQAAAETYAAAQAAAAQAAAEATSVPSLLNPALAGVDGGSALTGEAPAFGIDCGSSVTGTAALWAVDCGTSAAGTPAFAIDGGTSTT